MALRLLPSVHAFLLAQVKSGTSTVVKFQADPLWYLLAICSIYWHVDSVLARKLIVVWGLGYYVAAASKDMLLLPRPYQVFDTVECLDAAPARSPFIGQSPIPGHLGFSLPSLTAFSLTTFVICSFTHWFDTQQPLTALGVLGVLVWCLLCFAARVYTGVQTPVGLAAGALYAVMANLALCPLANALAHASPTAVMASHTLPLVMPMFLWGLLLLYPSPYRFTRTFCSTAAVMGALAGFSLGTSGFARLLLGTTPQLGALLVCTGQAPSPVMDATSATILCGVVGYGVLYLCQWVVYDALLKALPPLRALNPVFGTHLAVLAQSVELFDHSLLRCLPVPAARILDVASNQDAIETLQWGADLSGSSSVPPRSRKHASALTNHQEKAHRRSGSGAHAGQTTRAGVATGGQRVSAERATTAAAAAAAGTSQQTLGTLLCTSTAKALVGAMRTWLPRTMMAPVTAAQCPASVEQLLLRGAECGVGKPLPLPHKPPAASFCSVVPALFLTHTVMGLCATLLVPLLMRGTLC